MIEKIALIGECMLEISRAPDTQQELNRQLQTLLSYGGDSLNTAIYLSRLGIAVDYASALSDDNMSQWLLDQWQQEGIGCELVSTIAGSQPGLYMINTNASGERHFLYWRDHSPAKQLFCDTHALEKLLIQLSHYRQLFLTGITLALLSDPAREALYAFLADYRIKGGTVIFDSNYRSRLWSTKDASRSAYESMYLQTDIALPTLDDELLIFGDECQDDVFVRIQSYGVAEIALKNGQQGCWIIKDEEPILVSCESITAIDTTAAGDSFNAGYLATRIKGGEPIEAAQAGNQLASIIVQHKGAIIPKHAMP